MSSLYILETYSLTFASFANIFHHSEGCLFSLFNISFVMEKILSLISSMKKTEFQRIDAVKLWC